MNPSPRTAGLQARSQSAARTGTAGLQARTSSLPSLALGAPVS